MKIAKTLLTGLWLIAMALSFATKATADTITPGGYAPTGTTSFGTLAAATFGGTGIPNDAVQITKIDNLVLGLTATQRYGNPALTNDGFGTFNALAGGDTLNGKPAYGMWNFDFYVSGVPTGITTKLFYDLNSASGNDVSSFISLGGTNVQDSWNLGMGFLGGGFDPTAAGQYDFKLAAYNSLGLEVGYSSIRVNVGDVPVSSVPDGGTTLLLLGSGIMGLAVLKRRQSSQDQPAAVTF